MKRNKSTVYRVRVHVSITVLDSTNVYTQNFNSSSTTGNKPWVDNSTLPNRYMEYSKTQATTIIASNSSSATGALYYFGSINSTDRALGSINSGTSVNHGGIYYGVRMKNNTGVTIRAFSISFTGEQWRHSKESAQKLVLSYKTSISSPTGRTDRFPGSSQRQKRGIKMGNRH
jgi:hypothetical protein